MQIQRVDKANVSLSAIDPFLADLLRQIAQAADPGGSEAARARLYSKPSTDTAEAAFVGDWKEFVEPGLRHLFQTALGVIAGDLAKMSGAEAGGAQNLTIPVAHLEQWIHGLNQARLALTARHDFTEADMDRGTPIIGDARTLALLQVRFYGILEEWFLSELDPI